MKNILASLLLLAFIFQSCKKKDAVVAPAVACFTVDAAESTDSTHNFLFDQCGTPYDLSYWDFDDGLYSSNPNPSHQFNHYGSFNVKLTVTSTSGEVNSTTKTIVVGHYSLNKIVISKTWSYFTPLKGVFFQDSLQNDDIQVFIATLSALPIIQTHNDNVIFDLPSSGIKYYYVESDSTVTNFVSDSVRINSYADIINKEYHISFPTPSNDTAKISLYYKIVPR